MGNDFYSPLVSAPIAVQLAFVGDPYSYYALLGIILH